MPDMPKKKVLLVEDDTLLSSLLGRKLAQAYDVLYAPTGEAALATLDTETPEVILLDILLPGIDGFEVLRRVKANDKTKGIHVVVLSNLGEEEQMAKGRELGADQYVVKVTLTPDEVVKLVGTIISK
jgi:DNA-binding response OmpR family regulator